MCTADPDSWWEKEIVMPVHHLWLDKISAENHVIGDHISDLPFYNLINSVGRGTEFLSSQSIYWASGHFHNYKVPAFAFHLVLIYEIA